MITSQISKNVTLSCPQQITGTRSGGLPKLGLLLYLRSPNAYLEIDWDDELSWDSPINGYQATADDAALFAALGTPFWYATDSSDPVARSAAEIEAWSGINNGNVFFGAGRLIVYSSVTQGVRDKVMRYINEDFGVILFNGEPIENYSQQVRFW